MLSLGSGRIMGPEAAWHESLGLPLFRGCCPSRILGAASCIGCKCNVGNAPLSCTCVCSPSSSKICTSSVSNSDTSTAMEWSGSGGRALMAPSMTSAAHFVWVSIPGCLKHFKCDQIGHMEIHILLFHRSSNSLIRVQGASAMPLQSNSTYPHM